MTEIYYFVAEFLTQQPPWAQGRHSPHAQPQFSDAAVLTLALRQGGFEVATLKQTDRLVAHNWRAAVPHLPSYQQGLHRVHALLPPVSGLLATPATHPSTAARWYLVDSKPIPLCHSIRHGRVRLLRAEGAYFGKTRKGWFVGFKRHLLRHLDGRVLNIILTPGNCEDREPALALVQPLNGGVLLGALG